MSGTLLDGPRGSLFNMDPNELTIIGLDTKDGPEHVLWDERIKLPLDEAMVLNIMAHGVREPVIVSVTREGDKKIAAVVDGRRRVMHAREANRRLAKEGDKIVRVPVIGERDMSERDMSFLSASLNEIRLDDPGMVKVAKASRMKARGYTISEIAVSFGVDPQTVSMWLGVNGLSDATKRAITKGDITMTAASKLAGLAPDKQKEALEELMAEAANGQKPTAVAAKAKAKSKKRGVEVNQPPTRRALRRVVDNGAEVLSEDFLAGVRFAMGDLSPKSIKGLTALMEKPAKPAKTKEAEA